MNKSDQNRITKFIDDEPTSSAVYSKLEQSFTKPSKDRDVHVLASRFLALELLREAWKELERVKSIEDEEVKSGGNLAL